MVGQDVELKISTQASQSIAEFARFRESVAEARKEFSRAAEAATTLSKIDAFGKLRNSAQEANARMFQLRRTVEGLKQAYDGLAKDDPNRRIAGRALAEAERDLKRTTVEFDRLKGQVKAARVELEAAGVDVRRLAESRVRIQVQAENFQVLESIRRAIAETQARNAAAKGNALETLGLRGIGAVRGEIASVNAALATLRVRGASAEELARASEAARARLAALNAELRSTQAGTVGAESGIDALSARLAGIVSAAVAARAALAAVKSVVESGIAVEQQNSLLNLGNAGDAVASVRALAFIRGESDRLGLSLKVAATEFAKLNAAAAGTDLTDGQIRDIFSGVAEYATVARLSAEDFSGVMLAVTQILSKGTVSAEELRGQLGERLPGAFQIAAQAMGVTTAELGKLLQTGQLLSSDFLPKFAQALHAAASGGLDAAAGGTQAQLQRLENAFENFKQKIASSGVFDALNAELGRFLDQIDRMAASGELDKLAKDIADIMVGAIELMAALARGAVALRDEIGLLAQGLLALGAGAGVSWAYNFAKGLGAVAGAAGPAAAGIGLVSGALRLVPGLALGIIAIELGEWLLDLAKKAQKSGGDLEQWRRVIARIREENQDFQGTPRKSPEDLAGLSREDLMSYQESIRRAQLYYEAAGSELAQAHEDNLARQMGEEAHLYQEHQKEINAALNTRLANEKELANNVAAVRKGMLSELNEQLLAEKEALKQANADLQEAINQRKAAAAKFAAFRKEISQPLAAAKEEKKDGPDAPVGGSLGGFRAENKDGSQKTLTDASQAVGQVEQAAAQAANRTGKDAKEKAREALELADQAAGVLRDIRKEQEALPERQRKINEGDLGFMASRLETAVNEATQVEQNLAQANQEQAANQVATLQAQIAELQKPLKLDLVADPDNLDAIRSALERKLQGVTVQVSAVPVVAGGATQGGTDAAPAFASGGYTGPGGKYQPAGIVHAGEYVQPAERVREPGALGFLELFRQLGMRAVEIWNNGHAIGGLVRDSGLRMNFSPPDISTLTPAAAKAVMESPGSAPMQARDLVMPDGTRFPIQTERDVGEMFERYLSRAALAAGRRKP